MTEKKLTVHMIPKDQMPSFANLKLIKGGKEYQFNFIFMPRLSKDQFKLRYSAKEFPKDGSIEILISSIPNHFYTGKDDEVMHIARDFNPPSGRVGKDVQLDQYICHFPAKDAAEALEIAKFWSLYNLRLHFTDNKDVDKEIAMQYENELDEKIKVIQLQ